MNYCDAKVWNKNSKFQYFGCHATTIENGEKIIKEGFYPNSLFSTEHKFFQSIQVGESHGNKYIMLLVLFNVKNVLYDKDEEKRKKYEPKPWDFHKYCENLKKDKIDLIYESNSVLLLNPKNVTIFGYIMCDHKDYCVHYY